MTQGDPWSFSITLITPRGEEPIVVAWNCLGWQSILFLLVSLGVGLRDKYTKVSMMEAIAIGLFWTFVINVARILFIVLLGAYLPNIFAIVFYDYLAAITTLTWLFFFWWFSYAFVLESGKGK